MTNGGNHWGIRVATARDIDALAHFSALTALETEGKTLDKNLIRTGLASIVEQGKNGCMFIAESSGDPVGSLLLNGREFSEWRNGYFYWITGIYVVKAFRRTGLRPDLFRAAWNWASEQPGALGLRAYAHEQHDLELIMGTNMIKHHKRPADPIRPMDLTPYRILEVLFRPRD
jgi:GNAT superfamily N-acetyltransferase